MHYVSPIKLLREELNLEANEITARDLSLARRKLMAEAELSEQKTVIRDGVEFSKEDIVTLFDQLEKNLRIDFHLRIFNNKALLGFLETGIYDFTDEPLNTAEIKADAEYRDFIQPWFITVWIEAMLQEFRYRQFFNLSVLMQLGSDVIDEYLLPEIMEPFEAKLWDFEASATMLSDRIKSKTEEDGEVDVYISDELIVFFNQLPYTLSGFRNHYMIDMVNITVQLFNSGRRKQALAYGTIAMKLESDDFYKNQMADRLKFYKNKRPPTSAGRGTFRYWWAIAFVISIIARAGSCNENSSPTYNSFNNAYNTQSSPQYTVTATRTPLNKQEFYLYRYETDGIDNDSVMIAYLTKDRGNALFLNKLVKQLRQNIDKLNSKDYPVYNNRYYEMNVAALSSFIDSGWNKDFEENSLSGQNARAIIYNNSNTPMLLLYKYGARLVPLNIEPGSFREVELQQGYTIIAPFFGVDWIRNKTIYGEVNGKNAVLSYGWFAAKSGSAKKGEANLTMFKVEANEPYADTIRFNYAPGAGYVSTIVGSNIKMTDRIPLL